MAANDPKEVENVIQQVDNPPQVDNSLPALRDYVVMLIGIQSAIRRPTIQANNIKLKSTTLQLV